MHEPSSSAAACTCAQSSQSQAAAAAEEHSTCAPACMRGREGQQRSRQHAGGSCRGACPGAAALPRAAAACCARCGCAPHAYAGQCGEGSLLTTARIPACDTACGLWYAGMHCKVCMNADASACEVTHCACPYSWASRRPWHGCMQPLLPRLLTTRTSAAASCALRWGLRSGVLGRRTARSCLHASLTLHSALHTVAGGLIRCFTAQVPLPRGPTALRWLAGQAESQIRLQPRVYFSPRRSSAPDTPGGAAVAAASAGAGAVAGVGAAWLWQVRAAGPCCCPAQGPHHPHALHA
jgi:hypothetical protein